jgi:MFS family permease
VASSRRSNPSSFDAETDDMAPDRSTRNQPLTLALVTVGHAVLHAEAALLPLIFPIVIIEFALDPRDIGLFISVTSVVGGSVQLAYGFLTRYVARPTILAAGQLIFGASLLFGGLAQSAGHLLAAISGARVGASPQHPVGNALLTSMYPAERRGFVISAHISGGNVGTILVPFIGGAMIAGLGWQATLALFGAPAIAVGLLIAATVRDDGVAERDAVRKQGSFARQIRSILGRGDLRWILAAAMVAAGGRGLGILAPFMLLYMRGPLGLEEGVTVWLYALLLVGAILGPLLAGWISDRWGRRRTLVGYYLVSAVGILAFLAVGANLWLLVPLLLPFGGSVFSESPVLQAYLADRAPGAMKDAAFSVYFTMTFGLGAVWAFAIGAVAAEWGYAAAFLLMATSYAGAGVLLAMVREVRPKEEQAVPMR